MSRDISDGRKFAYYLGMGMGLLGFLSFFSVFVMVAVGGKPTPAPAVFGMGLIIVGAFIHSIGRAGLAGSGVVLDPKQARDDLEPYSRMVGGMVKDGLDEADIHLAATPEQVVKVRCQACGKLNDETAKFCQECGKKI